MPLCVILYKVSLKSSEEESIVMNYDDKKGPMLVKAGVKPIIRLMEAEYGRKNYLVATADNALLNPSVVAIGDDHRNLFKWGLLTDPYTVSLLQLAGANKLLVARCDGPNAMRYWQKGLKPSVPEQKDEISSQRNILPSGVQPSKDESAVLPGLGDSQGASEPGVLPGKD